jgi:hypothetical protein
LLVAAQSFRFALDCASRIVSFSQRHIGAGILGQGDRCKYGPPQFELEKARAFNLRVQQDRSIRGSVGQDRPSSLIVWVFLTLGIAMGCYWATDPATAVF